DLPMVGRKGELNRLMEAFANAAEQRVCTLCTVLGPAGIGKSRLAREFLASIDARAVTGRCLSYAEGITYWPVVEVVQQLGGSCHEVLAELPEAAAAIDALLGDSTSSTSEEIAWAVRKLLEASAVEQPLVIVFDDLHWGEPTFLDLVEHVA